MKLDRLTKFLKQEKHTITLDLGQFELVGSIGQGGNGIVYEAKFLDQLVAIKFLISDAKGKTLDSKISRFLAEYYNIITIEDLTGIVRYIDYDVLKFSDDKGELAIPVIIMKKYDCSLAKRQESKSEDEFKALFNFLLDTVEKIHSEGIVHRDIKPENILLFENKFVLADFGIASYNPEIFQIRAETDKKKERLGNRLFSAPEQEEIGIEPHPTMDIYAIGQVLQWYATGQTHRGTGRQSITSTFKEARVVNSIIEKCLENNPKNRFQSIQEIRDYLKNSRKKSVWIYLYLFNDICVRNFPKNEFGFVFSEDVGRIDRILNDLQENLNEFDKNLWWHDGDKNFQITSLLQKNPGVWKFWVMEYTIKDIWVHYDSSIFNDFILVHYLKGEPFIIDGKPMYHTAIVDDHHHISYSEYQNGYAEIDGKIEDLSKHKVEFIEREEEEGYFFIGTDFNCIMIKANDKTVREFLFQVNSGSEITSEDLSKFAREIRQNKNSTVEMEL